ncbi:TonB-dependent receptor [Rubrivivax gelatinosus]|uniref:TonB-dependent receptor n=1 Tax=Rubrivivax gelatinosus TaxID=28068 RepID=UPI0002ECC685|nr:TonB-dependent receptor [Rubrivivax gelatinosus]
MNLRRRPLRAPRPAVLALAIAAAVAVPARAEQIIVTANKIEERLQDVPASITVLDGEALAQRGLHSIADVVRLVPNMSSSFVFSEEVNLRGLNASTFTNLNPVVLYVDGVPYSSRYAYDTLLEGVERVEVLRGPQGTLYGKDSIGGVINVVTRAPGPRWQGRAGVEVANQSGRAADFSLSGPLAAPGLTLALAGRVAGDDGWIDNHHGGTSENANDRAERRLALTLGWAPSERLDIKLALTHDADRRDWIDGGLAPSGTSFAAYDRDDAENADYDVATRTKTITNAQALRLRWRLGDGRELNAVTTHKTLGVQGAYDRDWGSLALYDGLEQFQYSRFETWTQELRLSGGAPGGTRWVTGVYAERDRYRNTRYGMQYPGEAMGEPFGPGVDLDLDDPSTTRTTTAAVFGQAVVALAPRWELTLGARAQTVDKAFVSDYRLGPVGGSGATVYALDAEHRWNALLPKAALRWQATPEWSVWASVAKGYIPGGYNFWTSSAVESENRFEPQTSLNYELGLRSAPGRLQLSAALFYLDIRDIHVYSYDAGSGQIFTSNAGRGHSYGAELEANYVLSDRWELDAALGATHAVYDEHGSDAAEGANIERTPSYTLAVGLQYHDADGRYARVDLRGQGRRWFDAANTRRSGAWTAVDLRAGWQRGAWDVYAWVRNAGDKQVVSSVSEMDVGDLVVYGEPRRFGLGARWRF